MIGNIYTTKSELIAVKPADDNNLLTEIPEELYLIIFELFAIDPESKLSEEEVMLLMQKIIECAETAQEDYITIENSSTDVVDSVDIIDNNDTTQGSSGMNDFDNILVDGITGEHG